MHKDLKGLLLRVVKLSLDIPNGKSRWIFEQNKVQEPEVEIVRKSTTENNNNVPAIQTSEKKGNPEVYDLATPSPKKE